MSSATRLFQEHIERYNAGVRSGDFSPMVAFFRDDAQMIFEGVPAGPFLGREAIAEAYREQPPDDEVAILDIAERDDTVEAHYAWSQHPAVAAGRMRLTPDGDRIARLVVTFE